MTHTKEYQRAWRLANPERSRTYTKKYRLNNPDKARISALKSDRKRNSISQNVVLRNIRRLYGLTPEQYYALLGEQNGLCKCCKMINDGSRLNVDHKHVEGYSKLPPEEKAKLVRGLLCNACNLFIGHCKEESNIMKLKAESLSKFLL